MPSKPRHTLRLAAIPLCAVALIAAGCGGGSGYKDDLRSAKNEFKKSQKTSASKIGSATTKQQYTAGVNEFKGAIQTFEGKLRTLKPPSRASAAQTQLVGALDALSQDLNAILQAIDSGNIKQVQPLATKIPRDARAVEVAGTELDKKAR